MLSTSILSFNRDWSKSKGLHCHQLKKRKTKEIRELSIFLHKRMSVSVNNVVKETSKLRLNE